MTSISLDSDDPSEIPSLAEIHPIHQPTASRSPPMMCSSNKSSLFLRVPLRFPIQKNSASAALKIVIYGARRF